MQSEIWFPNLQLNPTKQYALEAALSVLKDLFLGHASVLKSPPAWCNKCEDARELCLWTDRLVFAV